MSGRQLNRFKIKRPHHEIEFHEVLLDSLAQKKERELGLSEQKLEVLLPQRILQVIWLGFLALSLMLFGKTVQLQIFQGEALAQASENNQYAIRFIQAQRGVIYDKNMIQLVFNKPSFDLIVRPLDLPDDQFKREEIFKNIKLVKTNSPLVTFSKAIHFLLPNLVAPIDRKYTINFFYGNAQLQNDNQFKIFRELFSKFWVLSKKYDLKSYKDPIWNKNTPKILDNAIIGYKILSSKK